MTAPIASFAVHARRGTDQFANWFTKGFHGVVTCDRWRPYERNAKRQVWWSHPERDLQAIIDSKRPRAEPATRTLSGPDTMFETWHRFKDGHIRRDELQNLTTGFCQQFKTFCTLGSRQKRARKLRALGRDLLRQWDVVFRFLDTAAWSRPITPPSAASVPAGSSVGLPRDHTQRPARCSFSA